MVCAWFMDDSNEDQRLPHHKIPPAFVSLSDLNQSTGVEYFKIDNTDPANDPVLLALKRDRGYNYEDEIKCSKECLPNYEEKLKNFFTEHLHTDEEIRLVMEGSGYFDVRDLKDQWIRIKVEVGDLLIIPAGVYHRFTLDDTNYMRAKRLFIGEPVWTPYNRPADEMDCRKQYLENLGQSIKLPVNERTSLNTANINSSKFWHSSRMFTLWYLTLGAREYRKLGAHGSPSTSTPSQPVPPQKPKATEPIPIAKPPGSPKPEPPKTVPPPSQPPPKSPPKPVIESPRKPEPPKQSPPKTPPSPKAKPPETPVQPSSPVPAKALDFPLPPVTPKTPEVPSSPQLTPKTPESLVRPKTPEPATPRTPESPKRGEPPLKPPRSPEPFSSSTPESPRPSPLSREDELMQKSLNFGQRPEANGSQPRDLSYGSIGQRPESNGSQNKDLSYGPRYQERPVISNPDSLESSETED